MPPRVLAPRVSVSHLRDSRTLAARLHLPAAPAAPATRTPSISNLRLPPQLPRQSRPYHASAPQRNSADGHEVVDLAYEVHEPPPPPAVGAQSEAKRGRPIVFMHGLFGSRRNNRGMSKVLARELKRPVYAVDLRNHGDSPHSPVHVYSALAADVAEFLATHKLEQPTLIGHSMGAKTALHLSLHRPTLIHSTIAIDNAPHRVPLHSDFATYIHGMRAALASDPPPRKQSDVDAALRPYAPDDPVRMFLMTNLVRTEASDGGHARYRWRVPLDILEGSLDAMADFAFSAADSSNGSRTSVRAATFERPTLFVRGTRSGYVPDWCLGDVRKLFPRLEVSDVEAGHWVVSENPEGFRRVVVEWLRRVEGEP